MKQTSFPKRVIALEEHDDGSWWIRETKRDEGIFPVVVKPNAREMIARLMQLVDVGPIAAQTYPERIGIDLPERGEQ